MGGVTQAPKPIMSNKAIVIMKIVCASIMFFACCLFFFGNIEMFWESLKSFSPFPFIFVGGSLYISVYLANLVGHIEDKNLYLADRHDKIFKAVFVITIMSMVLQSFLYASPLTVPVVITVMCILSGVAVLFTPKIIDNNNDEF